MIIRDRQTPGYEEVAPSVKGDIILRPSWDKYIPVKQYEAGPQGGLTSFGLSPGTEPAAYVICDGCYVIRALSINGVFKIWNNLQQIWIVSHERHHTLDAYERRSGRRISANWMNV